MKQYSTTTIEDIRTYISTLRDAFVVAWYSVRKMTSLARRRIANVSEWSTTEGLKQERNFP